MIYELFLEGQLADIRQDLGMQLNFNIDDINKYGSRDTSFSKTIVLPGTSRNNKILGFVGELGSFNPYTNGAANVNSNFNPAQTTKAELRANGLLILKGVFRLTGIVKDRDMVEYEGNLFGELGGFIAVIGRGKLENLNFDQYNHTYTRNNIVNSWDTINGSGYYYPLIDYGTYSNQKVDYDYRTFRPALYAKEYIDKIFQASGYTYESSFFDSAFFKSLIIPNNARELRTINDRLLQIRTTGDLPAITDNLFYFNTVDFGGDFSSVNGNTYTYDGSSSFKIRVNFATSGNEFDQRWYIFTNENIEFKIKLFLKVTIGATVLRYGLNGDNSLTSYDYIIPEEKITLVSSGNFLNNTLDLSGTITNPSRRPKIGSSITISNAAGNNGTYTITNYNSANNIITVDRNFASLGFYSNITLVYSGTFRTKVDVRLSPYSVDNLLIDAIISNGTKIQVEAYFAQSSATIYALSRLEVFSQVPVSTQALINDQIFVNDSIPKNVFQKDFLIWLIKMFNLYITEDKIKEKHLLIEPYVDYYDLTESVDWSYKVARDKPWQIKPMGLLTSRFYEYKYKDDTDFYNEGYKKKYNQTYGSNLQDTKFQFAKEKQVIDIGFSPSVLVEYLNRDKIVSALYKKSRGNGVDQEELTETNIRIMIAKKINGVNSWYIKNGTNNLGAALTSYGYAGHFDDPKNPTKDINFGASQEIYFDPITYTSNNLFNDYWSGYIAEIADKDSKILTCHVYLTELDIAQLDFSKPVFIDGVLWRINKIIDFDASSGELTKVELLKVINNG